MSGRRKHVVIVGSGIGGLSAAAHLCQRDADVTIFERDGVVGGKLRQTRLHGQVIDLGPTVLTMRWFFDDLFAALGERLDDHLNLQPLTPLARHHFSDGGLLDLFTNRHDSKKAIADFSDSKNAAAFLRFYDHCERIYKAVEAPFIHGTDPNLGGIVAQCGLLGLAQLARVDASRSMWRALCSFFSDKRLVQLFGRYATYCGASPFRAPATLNLIAYVEMLGVYAVEGGLGRLALCLDTLLRQKGCQIVTDTHVDEVLTRNGRVSGVRLASGESVDADAVVLNADVAAVANGLFGDAAREAVRLSPTARCSLSALTVALRIEAPHGRLAHHNVWFSDDSMREFDDILKRCALPSAPTVYLCAPYAAATPDGGAQAVFCIVNAPALERRGFFAQEEIDRCLDFVFSRLESAGVRLVRGTSVVMSTPGDFARRFPASMGALYGRATDSILASMQRQAGRTRLPGCYMAGGTVHPGPGVPMAARSGHNAARMLCEDLALTSPFHTTVTHGGILTA